MSDRANHIVQERRNELTGTTIRVNDFRDDPEFGDPEHPWVTACEEHQDGANWRTRASALSYAASPPDWCGGCEHEWNERLDALEAEEEIARERSHAGIGAKVLVTLTFACGCRYRGDEPVEAIVATRPGASRVCPKHRTSQVVTKTVLRLASAR